MPDQSGRTVVVTGANSGIGFEVAVMFARKGANVVLACRDHRKGAQAAERVRKRDVSGMIEFVPLDLADLDSIAAFAETFTGAHDRLDVLVNNAGVMWPPLMRTGQGFESQFGTNHLGHFALTGRLLPILLRTPGSRVTTATSLAQSVGRIDFDDLGWERRPYSPGKAYGQSKLANMMFVLELDRRLRAAGSEVVATASHPGWTTTQLTRYASPVLRRASPLIGMSPEIGALSTVRAATDPAAVGGSYWGPRHFFETKGRPAPARVPGRAKDAGIAARLWDVSTTLTGVVYAFPDHAGSGG